MAETKKTEDAVVNATGSSAGGTGLLTSVAGKGYGNVPDVVSANPLAAPYFGSASQAAWRSAMSGGSPYWSDLSNRLQTQGYNVAQQSAQEGQERERFRFGQEREKAAWINKMLPVYMSFLQRSATGGGAPGLDMNALLQQILAPLQRQQAQQRTEAKEDFGSLGRNIGENTAFQDIMARLSSQQGEDVGALSARTVLGALPYQLQAQNQQQAQMQAALGPVMQYLFAGRG